MMTKIASGATTVSIIDDWFGGDYARWSFGYQLILFYLDERYKNIIGHQGLLRFRDQFPHFFECIQGYCQKSRMRENDNGDIIEYPGLDHLPDEYRIIGFIDDSIDRISTPFSGPAGDYKGAPRRYQYESAQRAVYSGYKHCHGIKVETVFLPNGISTVFGPVSARRNDRGVLNMSGLNAFLELIQLNAPVKFKLLGDGLFAMGLSCIVSYYRAIPGIFHLTVAETTINYVLKSARMTIEKNYGMTNVVFRICNATDEYKLA